MIATWGAELGWQGQHDEKKAMAKLQYQSLRKWIGVVLESRRDKVDKIAAMESVGTFMLAAQARFHSRSMADPDGVSALWTTEVKQDNKGRTIQEKGRSWDVDGRIEEGFAAEFTLSANYIATMVTLGKTGTIA